MNALTRLEPSLSGRISHARRIVDFLNQLAHDYAAVNHAVVGAIATGEVPGLRAECEAIVAERDAQGEADWQAHRAERHKVCSTAAGWSRLFTRNTLAVVGRLEA